MSMSRVPPPAASQRSAVLPASGPRAWRSTASCAMLRPPPGRPSSARRAAAQSIGALGATRRAAASLRISGGLATRGPSGTLARGRAAPLRRGDLVVVRPVLERPALREMAQHAAREARRVEGPVRLRGGELRQAREAHVDLARGELGFGVGLELLQRGRVVAVEQPLAREALLQAGQLVAPGLV